MGLFTNLLNPKQALFILALLPQFIDEQKGQILMQFLTLGFIQIFISFMKPFGPVLRSASKSPACNPEDPVELPRGMHAAYLHALLLKRVVMGNVVIDHEDVVRTFPEGPGRVELVCVYFVEQGKI